MKTLKDLESFRLGKGQMNAVTGGYNCYATWEEGDEQVMIVKEEKGDPNEAQKVLQKSYAGTSAIIKCY